jgi:hypothetical protein
METQDKTTMQALITPETNAAFKLTEVERPVGKDKSKRREFAG